VLQSLSLRNIVIFVLANACNIGRALAEEKNCSPDRRATARYRERVRWAP